MLEVRLPPIGEGIAEGEVIQWLVEPGQTISVDQPLLEVLTDKASVEIPSPLSGVVSERCCAEGDLVPVGSVVLRLSEPFAQPAASAETVSDSSAPGIALPVMATPAIRQQARVQGLDLTRLKGSGPFGRILQSDLQATVPSPAEVTTPAPAPPPLPQHKPLVQPSSTAPEERIPLRGIRRKIAEQMVRAKFTAPDFLYADEVDLSELVEFRQQVAPELKQAGVKLTYLPFVIKAVISALKAYPSLNASLDENSQELVLKKYYHLGIATASPQGLLVPVIQNADQLSIRELALEIERLSQAVREGKAKPEELKGSTFTITNIGVIGGLMSAPIINYPEVAILGFNKIYQKPMVWQNQVVPRWACTFSLSVDHRVVDGAVAAYFLRHMLHLLEDPRRLLLE